jgi:hypothetical protein
MGKPALTAVGTIPRSQIVSAKLHFHFAALGNFAFLVGFVVLFLLLPRPTREVIWGRFNCGVGVPGRRLAADC